MSLSFFRRVAIGLGLVLVAALAGLFVFVVPYVESGEFKASLVSSAAAAFDRELDYQDLSLGLLPLGIEIRGAVVGGHAEGERPTIEADHLSLRMALLPLLMGRVVIRSFHLEGASVWVVRTRDGLELPGGSGASASDASPSEPDEGEIDWLPSRVILRNARLTFDDRASSPPMVLTFSDVNGEAQPSALYTSADVDLETRMETGGQLRIRGTLDRDASYHAEIRVDALDLGANPLVRGLLGGGFVESVEGLVTGDLTLDAPGGTLGRVTAQLAVEDAGVAAGALRLRGRADLDVDLEPSGSGKLGIDLELDRGGRVTGRGIYGDGTISDIRVDLEAVALAPLLPLLSTATALAGAASGSISLSGSLEAPGSVEVDLSLANSVLRIEEVALVGDLELDARLDGAKWMAGSKGSEVGEFSIDATGAELDYEGVYHKPPGTRAMLKGRLLARPTGGIEPADLHLELKDFEAKIGLRFEDREALSLAGVHVDADPIDVSRWGEDVAVLPRWLESGAVTLQDLQVGIDPLQADGRLGAEALTMRLGGFGVIAVTGVAIGRGDSVQVEDALLEVGGQILGLNGEIVELGAAKPFRMRVATRGDPIDSNRFLAGLEGREVLLHGPLQLEVDLGGSLRDLSLEALHGRLKVKVGGEYGQGRIEGFSLLALALDKTRGLLEIARLAGSIFKLGKRRDGQELDLRDDVFDLLEATVTLVEGRVETQDLRIRYPGYEANLRGSFGIRDRGLDLTGDLTLFGAVHETLVADVKAGGLRIPIAHVGGTLEDPKIRLDRAAAELLAGFFLPADAAGSAINALGRILRGN